MLETLDAGRDPERAAMRRVLMHDSATAFFAGTSALFNARLAQCAADIPSSPLAWCSGNLHLGSVGAYRADNKLAYFDLTRLDESALAPVAWDLVRLATSIRVAARTAGQPERSDDTLVHAALADYGASVTSGTVRWVERSQARGPIRKLLKAVGKRSRGKLVKAHTVSRRGKVALRHDGRDGLEPDVADRELIEGWFAAYREADPSRRDWELVDIARRSSDVSQLGYPHWILLVRTSRLHLLDLRGCVASSLAASSATLQPGWSDEASRVEALIRRLPVLPPPRLAATRVGEIDAIVSDFRPAADDLSLDPVPAPKALKRVVRTVAKLAGWAHLRAAGRQGADRPDALAWWGREAAAFEQISRLSRALADEQLDAWHEFRENG